MAITKLPVSAIEQLIEYLNSIGISTYKTYGTIALMIAGQADQQPNSSIIVNDASADPTVGSGGANYEYLGTTNGDLTDYRKLSEEESMDLDLSIYQLATDNSLNTTDKTIVGAINEVRDGYEYAEQRYVDLTNGNDTNSGRYNAPYKTVDAALAERKLPANVNVNFVINVLSGGQIFTLTYDGTGVGGRTWIKGVGSTNILATTYISTLTVTNCGYYFYLENCPAINVRFNQTSTNPCYVTMQGGDPNGSLTLQTVANVDLCKLLVYGGSYTLSGASFGGTVELRENGELAVLSQAHTIYRLNTYNGSLVSIYGTASLAVTESNLVGGVIDIYGAGVLNITNANSFKALVIKEPTGTFTIGTPTSDAKILGKYIGFDNSSGTSLTSEWIEDAIKEIEGLIPVGGGLENRYATIAAMIAGQGNQSDKGIQYVADASADSTVTSGYAYYEYLGTTVGDLTDYRKLTEQESLDIDLSIYQTTSGMDTIAKLNAILTDATLIDTNDSRLSDTRTPTSHASSHTDGTDDIQSATNAQKGLATAAHIQAIEANSAKVGVTTQISATDINTLAKLNAIIADATLDTNTETRVPTDASVTNAKLDSEVDARFTALGFQDPETLTDQNTIALTKPVGVMTCAADRSITSITGIAGGGTALIRFITSNTLSFSGLSGLVYAGTLSVKATNNYLVKVINMGTTISPAFFVMDADGGGGSSLTASQIEALMDAYYTNTNWRTQRTTQSIVDAINAVTTDPERLDYLNLKNLPTIDAGLSASIVIENTDVLALNATPAVLKTAPGTGKIDYVNECFGYVEFNTTAYATNTTLNLLSGSTIIGTCDILGLTSSGWKLFTMNGNSPEPNAALTVATATGEAVNGDSHVGIVAGLVQRDVANWTFPSYATAPGAPTALSSTVNSNEIDIDLSWTAPASDGGSAITGYKIERDTDGGGYSTIVANTGTTGVTYTDEDPGNGTQSYRISAINSIGTGSASTADSAVINITYNINSDYLAEQPWTDPTIPNGHSLINGPQDATSLLDEVAAGMRFKTLNAKDMQVANSGDDSAIQNNYSYKTFIEIDSITEGGVQLVTDGTSGSAHTTTGRKFETIETGASRGDVRIRKAGSVDADVVIRKLKVWGGTPIPQAFEILIDVGVTTTGVDSNGDQWNNMTAYANGTLKQNLVDTDNQATGIDYYVTEDLADGAGNLGTGGVNSAGGGWPASVWTDYHSGGLASAANGQAEFRNLPDGYTYTIQITGSRDMGAPTTDRRLEIGADSDYSGQTDWYDANSNIDPNENAQLTGLTKDANNKIVFYYRAYNNSTYCYIGAIKLIATPI